MNDASGIPPSSLRGIAEIFARGYLRHVATTSDHGSRTRASRGSRNLANHLDDIGPVEQVSKHAGRTREKGTRT